MNARNSPQHITVGIDGSIGSHAALLWAVDHARPGDTVHLVHAWQRSPVIAGLDDDGDDDDAAWRLVDREVARARCLVEERDIAVTGEVLLGVPGNRLARVPTDLLVVGAQRHRALVDALTGSVQRSLLRHAYTPVVIVPDRHTRGERRDRVHERLGEST